MLFLAQRTLASTGGMPFVESEDGVLMFSFSRHLMRAGSLLRRAMMLRTTGGFGTPTASPNLSLHVKLAGPVHKSFC